MEQHIIPLNKGIHLTPSVGEDGELLDAINLMPKNGSLRNVPVLKKRKIGQQDETIKIGKIVCIHKVNGGENILSANTDNNRISIYLNPDTEPIEPIEPILTLGSDVTISQIETIGNTLVVLATDGMHYLLWKDDAYKYLGTHFPELPISFGLQGGVEHSDVFQLSSDTSARRTKLYAEINKFISEQHSSGKFLFPFFVRYAYRLYDNTSMVMQSAPVLMVASAGVAPNVIGGVNNYVEVVAVASQLDYLVEDATLLTQLNDWSDIVASVDIFVSAPIYTYNQNDEDWDAASQSLSTEEVDNDMRKTFSVYKQTDQNKILFPTETYPIKYQKRTLLQSLIFECGHKDGNDMKIYSHARYINNYIKLPRKSEGKVKEELRDCSTFYLLRSLKLNELATSERTIIEITDDYLQTLTSRETLTDDYNSHDLMIPQRSFVYNSRLNIANIKRTLYNGYPSKSIVQKTDGFVKWYSNNTSPTYNNNISGLQVFIYINQDGKDIIVSNTYEAALAWMSKPLYIFYPNANAYKAVLRMSNWMDQYYELPLERHNFLNGAFYFNGWDEPSAGGPIPDVTPDRTVAAPNKIYTSVVNNPFYFPPKGINTVGTGDVIGIRSANKALSQGQFGQFPLYAFCSDGIWALETKEDGTYRPSQPINRDVCSNPNSILQIDDAVIYATKQGLKLIRGSETSLLTPQFEAHQEAYTENVEWASALPPSPLVPEGEEPFYPAPAPNLIELLQNQDTKLSFDGINRIVHVYGGHNSQTHYILSLDNGEWVRTTQPTPIAFVDGYPNAVLQIGDTLYEYINAGTGKDTFMHGFAITRETALGNPLVMKSLQDLKMLRRYYNQNSAVRVIPYVSNDRMHWSRLTSLRQRSCKWIRFAIYTKLTDADMLEGMALLVDKRMTNKLR